MSKIKTRKAVAKRIRVTKRGKVKKSKASSGHLLTSKSRKRKRHLKKKNILSNKESKKLRAMTPYKK